MVAMMAVGTALASLGATFAVHNRYPVLPEPERRSLLRAICTVATGTTALWAVVVGLGFTLGPLDDLIGDVSGRALLLAIASMVVAPFWLLTVELLTVQERAAIYAASAITQSLATAIGTIVALFVFDLGGDALFVGLASGSAAVLAASTRVLLPAAAGPAGESELRPQLHRAWQSAGAQLTDVGYPLLERSLLSAHAGLHQLGLYTHAQRYRDIAGLGVKSISRGAWPVMLEEARDDASDFIFTASVWRPIHLLVASGGCIFAGVGAEFISILTNDKFTDAYVYGSVWIGILLAQYAARAQSATIWARSSATIVGRIGLYANVAAAVSLCIAVPFLGASGALLAMGVQVTVHRTLLHVEAKRLRSVPFQDEGLLVGLGAITVVLAASVLFEPPFWIRLLLVVVAVGGMSWTHRSTLRAFTRLIRPAPPSSA